jgi:hypothetical protein
MLGPWCIPFNYVKLICSITQRTMFLITQFSQPSCYFFSFRSKYTPQHSVLKTIYVAPFGWETHLYEYILYVVTQCYKKYSWGLGVKWQANVSQWKYGRVLRNVTHMFRTVCWLRAGHGHSHKIYHSRLHSFTSPYDTLSCSLST